MIIKKNGQASIVTVSFASKWHIVYANNQLETVSRQIHNEKRLYKRENRLHLNRMYQNTYNFLNDTRGCIVALSAHYAAASDEIIENTSFLIFNFVLKAN